MIEQSRRKAFDTAKANALNKRLQRDWPEIAGQLRAIMLPYQKLRNAMFLIFKSISSATYLASRLRSLRQSDLPEYSQGLAGFDKRETACDSPIQGANRLGGALFRKCHVNRHR